MRLFIDTDYPLSAAVTLKNDLAKMSQWARKCLVSFNPSKSEYVIYY